MIVPILPVKCLAFSDARHLIAFIEDEIYDAVEVLDYKESTLGKGIEVILTKKDGAQIILANTDRIYENKKKAKKEAYLAETELEISESNRIIVVRLNCKSDFTDVEMEFESLFPLSDIRKGKVDPRRHSKASMPFMYSASNTVGKNCRVVIGQRAAAVRRSKDDILKQFNGLQAYYADDFYLGILVPQNDELKLVRAVENKYIYSAGDDEITYEADDHRCSVCYSCYDGDCHFELLNDMDGQTGSSYKMYCKNRSILQIFFEPQLYSMTKEGDVQIAMRIEIPKQRAVYDCRLFAKTKKLSEDESYSYFHAAYSISYEEAEWEESRREYQLEAEYKVQKQDNTIVNYKICKIQLKST